MPVLSKVARAGAASLVAVGIALPIAALQAAPAYAVAPLEVTASDLRDVPTVASTVTTRIGTRCAAPRFAPRPCGATGVEVNYGRGTDVELLSFAVGGRRYTVPPPNEENNYTEIFRVDNPEVQGVRELVWVARENANNLYNVRSSNPRDKTQAEVLSSPVITEGSDNTFANDSQTINRNNIERISMMRRNPVITNSPANTGFTVLERGGNDPFKVAAVTAVDANGTPTAWGPMITVPANQWGTVLSPIPTLVMTKTANDAEYVLTDATDPQRVGGVYVSLADLGIAPKSPVFGVSILPNDATTPAQTNPRLTTNGGNEGGIDLISGLFVSSADPVARPDTSEGLKGDPQTLRLDAEPGDNLSELDPTQTVLQAPEGGTVSDDGLTVTMPGQGTYVLNRDTGEVTFTPEPDFVGTATPVPYRVTDINGRTASSTLTPTVKERPPTANPDSATTRENTPVNIPLLDNDTGGDAPLDRASVRLQVPPDAPANSTVSDDGKTLTMPGVGVYTVNNDGVATFTPERGFTGKVPQVPYSVADTSGTRANSTIDVTVNPATPPTANPDERTTPQNTPVDVPLLDNDTPGDVPLDPASARLQLPTDRPEGTTLSDDGKTLTMPGVGTYTVNDQGVARFTPEPQFTGKVPQVPYTVADQNGETATSTVDVTVDPAAPPTARPDERTTPQNTPVSIPLLDNDSAGGAPLDRASVRLQVPTDAPDGSSVSGDGKTLTMPGVGVYTVDDQGVATFTPDPEFTGKVPQVPYTVQDTNGNQASSTIDVTVNPATPPTARPDEDTTPQNTPVDIPLLGNDSPGSAPLDPASVRLQVPPDAPDATVSADGKTLTIPGVGVYTVNDQGVATFTPEPQFTGKVPQVPYTVADETGNTASSTIDVTVTPVDGPTASPDSDTTEQNTPVELNLLENDTPGGAPLDPASVRLQVPSDAPDGSSVSEDGKTLTMPGVGVYTVDDEGVATFTPEPQFTGKVPQVPYTVADENGNTASSTIDVTVEPGEGPSPNPDFAQTPVNQPVEIPLLGNDDEGDAPLDPSSVRLRIPDDAPEGSTISDDGKTLTMPGVGTMTVNDDGVATFTPDPEFSGHVPHVPYSVADENGNRGESFIHVVVGDEPVDEPPTANPDEGETQQNVPVDIPLLGNDTEGDAPIDPSSVRLSPPVDSPDATVSDDGKTLTIPGVGVFTVNDEGVARFVPDPGFTGKVPQVPYSVADENGNRGNSTIDVTVEPADGPTASPDEETTPQNTPVDINLLTNDTAGTAALDPASVLLRVPDNAPEGSSVSPDGKTVTMPGVGVMTVNDEGVATFTPEPQFTGKIPQVPYSVDDTNGNRANSTIDVTVEPAEGPTATPDSRTTGQNEPVDIPLLGNDTPGDAPLDPGSVRLRVPDDAPDGTEVSEDGKRLTIPGVGVFTVNDEGVARFVPEPGFTGKTPQVPYSVQDENGNTANSTVDVTVEPADGPTASPDSDTTPQNTPVDLPLLGNDTPGDAPLVPGSVRLLVPADAPDGTTVSEDGKTLTIPGVGVYTVNAQGVARFVPEPQFTGKVPQVPYTVEDENGNVANSTIDVTVNPANPPTANPDEGTTKQNEPVDVPLLENDTPGDAPLVPDSVRLLVPPDAPPGSTVSEDGKTLNMPGIGTITVNNRGIIRFTPEPGFTGKVPPVPYTVEDENGNTGTSTVTLVVEPGDGPNASPDEDTTPQDTPVDIPLLGNDTPGDAPLDPASVQLQVPADAPPGSSVSEDGKTLTMPGVGVFTVNDQGVATFTPEPQFVGKVPQVPYSVADTNGNRASSTIDVTVTPTGSPRAEDDIVRTPPGTPIRIPVLDNDEPGDSPLDPGSVIFVDVDLPPGSVISDNGKRVTVPGVGEYVIDDDGIITFTPVPGFTGETPPITYQVTDNDGHTSTAKIVVEVEDPIDPGPTPTGPPTPTEPSTPPSPTGPPPTSPTEPGTPPASPTEPGTPPSPGTPPTGPSGSPTDPGKPMPPGPHQPGPRPPIADTGADVQLAALAAGLAVLAAGAVALGIGRRRR